MATEVLTIRIRSDGSRIVSRDLKRVGATATAAASGVRLLRRALLFIGVTAAIRSIIRTLANFGQAISTVQAVTRATGAEFDALSKRARDLGRTTRFTATQAAEGMVELARAGLEVNETLIATEQVLLLAQATNIDLALSARIAANTMRAFKKDAEDLEKVVDILTNTANSSTQTIVDLAEAMKLGAPAAVKLKIPLETVSAALGVLADNAQRGSIGGAGFAQLLARLAKRGPKLATAIRRGGFALEDFNVETQGLIPVLRRLGELNLSTAEEFEIFEFRAFRAAAILSTNVDAVQKLADENGNLFNVVRDVARIMDDNLNGALLRVKSAMEAVVLEVGELGVTEGLTTFMNKLAEALRFLARNADLVKGALGGLAVTQIPLLIRGLRLLFGIFSASPIGIVVIALGVLIARSETLQDTILGVFDAVKGPFQDVFNLFTDLGSELGNLVLENIAALGDLDIAFDAFFRFFDNLIGVVSGSFAAILVLSRRIIEQIKETFTSAENVILFRTKRLNELVKTGRLRKVLPGKVDKAPPGIAETFEGAGKEAADAFNIGFLSATTGGGPGGKTAGFLASATANIEARKAQRQAAKDQIILDGILLNLTKQRTEATKAETEAERLATLQVGRLTAEKLLGEEAGKAFSDVLLDARITAEEFGASLGGLVVGAVDRLSGAIADLAISGFRDFESFKEALSNIFRDLAREIVKLIIKFLILEAISASFGTTKAESPTEKVVGGVTTGTFNALIKDGGQLTQRQGGGPLRAGQTSVVGERGPELFTPTRGGNVTPASQLGGGGGGAVTVVVVKDRDEMLAVMSSAEGKKVIIGAINDNPQAFQQAIR